MRFRDIRKFKEAKKQFEKVSEEKEAALAKNAQVPRNKQHEVEEATNILTATRKCFRHIALDYVLQVSPVRRTVACGGWPLCQGRSSSQLHGGGADQRGPRLPRRALGNHCAEGSALAGRDEDWRSRNVRRRGEWEGPMPGRDP